MKTHRLRLKTNITKYTEAKKFIHATHILYQTTQSPVSWRYPEPACKTKYICSLSKKTQHILRGLVSSRIEKVLTET